MFRQRRALSEELPFEDHIDDPTVLMKSGAVMALFKVDGIYPETADALQVEAWLDQLHNAWRSIAAEDVEIHHYLCRGDEVELTHSGEENGLAAEIDRAYRKKLSAGSLFSLEFYLGVQVHPPGKVVKGLTRMVADPAAPEEKHSIEDLQDRLTEICLLLEEQLHSFGLKRLGYEPRGWRICDELAEAYVYATTGTHREIPATTGRMGEGIFTEDIKFRWRHIRIDGAGEPKYAAMFAFKDYPGSVLPGMFQTIAAATYQCTLAQSYRFLSHAETESAFTRKQNKMLVARDKAHSQVKDLELAHNQYLNGEIKLGDHSLVLIVFAESRRKLNQVANTAWRDLASSGIVAVRLKGTLQAGWLSMLPGGDFWRPRPGYLKSTNFVAMAPSFSWPTGEDEGFWPGGPIAYFRLLSGIAYRFHWHVRDVGNTLITGTTGSGKTTLVAFLIMMTASRARIIGFDHKRGWQFLTRRHGGDYAVPGPESPALAPLKHLPRTPASVAFLTDLLCEMIGGSMTAEETRRLSLWLNTVWPTLPLELCTIGELRAIFDDNPEGAGARLEPWIWGNELGWALDAPKQTIEFARFTITDTTDLLDNARARDPMMMYLFYCAVLVLDGSPTAILCDEGWLKLKFSRAAAFVETIGRTARSKNGFLVFITQAPDDIGKSDISAVLRTQFPNRFHLNDPWAQEEDYKQFGVVGGRWAAFKSMPDTPGTFLLQQGERAVIAQLPLRDLDLGYDILPILSAPEAALRADDKENGMKEAA